MKDAIKTPDELPCAVCGERLENYMAGEGVQPSGGTEFITHGHYGSATFDPMDGTFLSIVICDECLRFAGASNRVFHGVNNAPPSPPPPRHIFTQWKPPGK